MQKPEIKKSEFIKLVETKTKAQVADYYGLTEKDVTKIAGQLKVTFKKRKEDNFIIIDDTIETPQDVKEFLNNVPDLEPIVSNIAVNTPTSEEMMLS